MSSPDTPSPSQLQERSRLRNFYRRAWEKRQAGEPLEPLERVVADVIGQHPEYHELVLDPNMEELEFSSEPGGTNPFMHMGMHIAIHEQLGADRPAGIRALYNGLQSGYPDRHELEHRLIECLARSLVQAKQSGRAPDEAAYLECARRLLPGGSA